MAQPTTPFTSATKKFVIKTGEKAATAANFLNVPQNAIVGAVANEFDTRHNEKLSGSFHGGFWQAAADWWVDGDYTHQQLAENHKDVKSGDYLFGLKANNPAMVDIGPGNIRISTAIDLIKEYSAKYGAKGDNPLKPLKARSKPLEDPLNLLKYEYDYALLVQDLLNFEDPTTSYALAGLYLKKGQDFFIRKSEPAWNAATPDEKDALLVTYYKLGEKRIEGNIDKGLAKAKSNGTPYRYNPRGDGGQQHLNNADKLRVWLKEGNPPLAEQIRVKDPAGSLGTEVPGPAIGNETPFYGGSGAESHRFDTPVGRQEELPYLADMDLPPSPVGSFNFLGTGESNGAVDAPTQAIPTMRGPGAIVQEDQQPTTPAVGFEVEVEVEDQRPVPSTPAIDNFQRPLSPG